MQRTLQRTISRRFTTGFHRSLPVAYSEEVQQALHEKQPIVAFETSIATQGLPAPFSTQVPKKLEGIVRDTGAIPATIGVLDGIVKIGLSEEELAKLVQDPKRRKLSTRDLGHALATQASGGTTVAATSLLAKVAGIRVFATGGIGGVHRNAETTMDISADLIELSRTNTCVVCAGPKSILDIGKTLEVLESYGVSVATYKSRRFPAFYTPDSGFASPLTVENVQEAADLILYHEMMNVPSGLLLCVPIPEHAAKEGARLQASVEQAVHKLSAQPTIGGKEVTPWLLSRINDLTQGKNVALIENNTRVAAELAKAYQQSANHLLTSSTPTRYYVSALSKKHDKIQETNKSGPPSQSEIKYTPDLLILGSAALDITSVGAAEPGTTVPGSISIAPGGVARNIADAAFQMGARPLLVAKVGQDAFGESLISDTLRKGIRFYAMRDSTSRTAVCNNFLDMNGQLVSGVADMAIAESIGHEEVIQQLTNSPTIKNIVLDGNLAPATMHRLLLYCSQNAFFEPTSNTKATRIITKQSLADKALPTHVFPNLAEVDSLYRHVAEAYLEDTTHAIAVLKLAINDGFFVQARRLMPSILQEHSVFQKVINLLPFAQSWWIKLGPHGILAVYRTKSRSEVWQNSAIPTVTASGDDGRLTVARYYNAHTLDRAKVKSVTGAGDTLCASIVSSFLKNPKLLESPQALDRAVHLAQSVAVMTLQSDAAVSDQLSTLLRSV